MPHDLEPPALPWPAWVGLGAAALFALALLRLWRSGAWSFRWAVPLAGVAAAGLGAAVLPGAWAAAVEGGRAVRTLEFVRPAWLALLIVVPVAWHLGRRSLAGLGPVRRRAAVGLRSFLLACLVLALAEPQLRLAGENVTVLFVVDRSFSVPPELDADRLGPDGAPLDARWERVRRFIDDSVRLRGPDRREDRAGVILFGRRPKLALPPAAVDRLPVDERLAGSLDGQYTDIAAALKLALASFPEGTGRRIVLISDGNENLGRAEVQAQLARRQGATVDVVPLAAGYRNENEVLVQSVEAPPQTTKGGRLPVRVFVRNAHPTRVVEGSLEVVQVRDREVRAVAVADGPGVVGKPAGPARVRLRPGLNVFRFRDRADDPLSDADVSSSYRATFVPIRSFDPDGSNAVAGLPGDRSANNRAGTAVVARGKRRVLFLEEQTGARSGHKLLLDTLRAAGLRVDALAASALPADKADLGVFLSNYDCLVVADVPAEALAGQGQMEAIRDAVADQGCGLVVVGGPSSYGPGGYRQTALEQALPVDCEIEALEAVAPGGLVLVVYDAGTTESNGWQNEVAKLAIERLGPADMAGVLHSRGAASWLIPFQAVGDDKGRFLRQLDRMTPGDMPDFEPFLQLAADELADPKHALAARHVIVIGDGDPSYGVAGKAAVARMAAGGITCTTVGRAARGAAADEGAKGAAGPTRGNFYAVADPTRLRGTSVEERRRVSQSFLYTEAFDPKLRIRGGPTAQLPDKLPPLHGFVRTTLKPSAVAEMAIEGPRVQDRAFPILAHWQYGAGRAVAFTSDARSQPGGARGWDRDWIGSDLYRKFWDRVVNWAMRSAETGRLAVLTEYRDGKVRVTVDARDEKDRPLAGIALRGKVTAPGPPQPGEGPPTPAFHRAGDGRYEAEFPAEEAGSYFVSVQALRGGEVIDAARAGATVPYSPEFADLESNAPLLGRLAEITGGKVYDEADLERVAKSGDIFRPAPATVRALLPFWFWLVFAAGIALPLDVGVRRLAPEPAEARAWAARLWRKLRTRRDATASDDAMGRLFRAKESAAERIEREAAGRRFEPGPTTLPPPAPPPPESQAPQAPPLPPPPPPETGEPDDFLSRMQRAKRRAKPDGE